jgi:SAM-dependent methyltransferase
MTTTETPAGALPAPVDPAVLEAYAGRAAAQATAALNAALVHLGDRLGLWKAMVAAGPVTATALAERTGLSGRYLQEWLASQAANGFVSYDPATDRFTLGPEGAMVLADDGSPASMIAAFDCFVPVTTLLPRLEAAFRTGDGIAWPERDVTWFETQARFSRPVHQQFIDGGLDQIPGLRARLEAGATVADVGCGYGVSTILLAERFPASRLVGFDFHDHSIAQARKGAETGLRGPNAEAGVGDRVTFEVAAADSFPGTDYDVVFLFDALHDLGDPVAALRHVRDVLAPGGIVVAADPSSADTLAENLANPMAGFLFAISTLLCTPTALAQPGPHALGAMGGETALRALFRQAGFAEVERVAPDAPFNMILTARK